MKLLFLITKLDYSGGPKMLSWVANQFAKNGDEVYICSIYSDKCDQPLDKRIKFISLSYAQSKNWIKRNIFDMPKIIKTIRRTASEIKPDFIVSFAYSVDIFYLLFSKKDRQKTIFSMRLDPYSEKGIMSKIRHNLMKRASGLVFQTEGAMRFYGKKVRKKSTVIPNPVTSKTLSFSSQVKSFVERKNIIVLPARLNVKQKRQDIALKAFSLIHEKHPDYKLMLLGDGPDKIHLKKLAIKYGISDGVIFHGAASTAEQEIINCKIMILCSDFEGIPNSLIEAMSLGLCVVSTDCSPGGAKMLIRDGENGYLVKRGDYNALANRVCSLIENPSVSLKMEHNATMIKNDYSEKNISERWISFLKTIEHL